MRTDRSWLLLCYYLLLQNYRIDNKIIAESKEINIKCYNQEYPFWWIQSFLIIIFPDVSVVMGK